MDGTRVLWELEQRRLITEMLYEYCALVDANDPQTLVHQVFAPDGAFELGSHHAVVGREDLARMFTKTLALFDATSHHVSNVRIAFDGDHGAHSVAYVYAWHHTHAGDRVEVWGRYTDRHVLTEDGWRIANRHLFMHGVDGWKDAAFEMIVRQPSPADTPSPKIQRR